MKKCNYCGEIVPCRKEYSLCGENEPHWIWSFLVLKLYRWNWICDKCIKYWEITRENNSKEEEQKIIEGQKKFRMERDKLWDKLLANTQKVKGGKT